MSADEIAPDMAIKIATVHSKEMQSDVRKAQQLYMSSRNTGVRSYKRLAQKSVK
jgi:hypothetical protein